MAAAASITPSSPSSPSYSKPQFCWKWLRCTGSGKSAVFFRKFSGRIVAAFKACNLGCLGGLSSRPACPWGCTPTNRLYCGDMT